MKCEQKSGVFLNISCNRTVTETCSNCGKKVCEVHAYKSKGAVLCEDCYWENYLYAIEDQSDSYVDVFIENNSSSSSFGTSNTNSTEEEGFQDGFEEGNFGGGGAAAAWTEGEMESLNDDTNNTAIGGLLDTDDTFFYS